MNTLKESPDREEPRTNPYLIPVHAGQAGRVYSPTRLQVAILELKNASNSIAATVFRAGYAYPRQDIVEQHSLFETTDDGMEVTFPKPGPGPDDTVMVLDHEYRCREVTYDQDTIGGTIYFDLDTGNWVTFTPFVGNTHLSGTYDSLAAKYPVPQEDHSA